MVNVADIHAMGGRPIAVVDVLWGTSGGALEPIWEGLRAASRAYGVPIVGGHTNARSPYDALAVAVLGRAARLLSGYAARPGDALLLAVDLRGRMHPEHPFWDASTGADPARLRGDLEVLPELAESGRCDAAKDVSMGGIIGTLLMLLETSGAGAALDLEAIPRPLEVPLARWLLAFPSYGFLLSVRPDRVGEVRAAFARRDLACAQVGAVDASRRLSIRAGGEERSLWDLAAEPLTGFSRAVRP
jgi:AIR synthase-related protein